MGYDSLWALDPFVKVMIYVFFVQVISKAISYLMISDLMDIEITLSLRSQKNLMNKLFLHFVCWCESILS